ncbi:MAG: response regulator [Candidatus Omnitrophica bacterium]|nr:response regulator [Candidatus Omnitrophota bacterium]MBU1128201.1 response regulator [Candidatus Omnitrophota bacterium]MBU1784381.1 response regulator [Candidatus Omnitrophota bacterium]
MKKNRILVVDDETNLVKAIEIRLKQANYEVLTAGDGIEGLEKAKKERPDLILLDVLMPGMDGYQTLVELKALDETKSIPVVMLTAKGQVEDVVTAQGMGADDYVVKPYNFIILLEKIRNLLNTKKR